MSLRSMKKCAEVKCERLEDVIKGDDRVFCIREYTNQKAQADILSKVEACLFDEAKQNNDALQYTYNSFYGSCQTFCSKILGFELFEDLNPEVAHVEPNRMKGIAGWWLSDEENSDELIKMMSQRFERRTPFTPTTPRTPQEERALLTSCPRRLGQLLDLKMTA